MLKRIRKPPFLLSQKKSLAEKVEKYPCLFGKSRKTYKEGDVFQKYFLIKNFCPFFEVFLKKFRMSCQTRRRPSL